MNYVSINLVIFQSKVYRNGYEWIYFIITNETYWSEVICLFLVLKLEITSSLSLSLKDEATMLLCQFISLLRINQQL